MTDDATGTDPTNQPGGRSWRTPLLVGALVVVIVVVVAYAVGRGNDDDGTAASSDPTTSSTTSTPSTPSTSTSPSTPPSASASPSAGDPTPSPVINRAAKAAIKDHFPALVPAGVPAGWTVVSASYDAAKGGTWRIDLTDSDGGDVVLVQSTASVQKLVADYLGADGAAEGKVDLTDYGTGVWTAYGSMDLHGIAKKISDTNALVYATTQDTAVALAEELLTAEDGGNTDGG
jgi:cytoskeletal protein RodZ